MYEDLLALELLAVDLQLSIFFRYDDDDIYDDKSTNNYTTEMIEIMMNIV